MRDLGFIGVLAPFFLKRVFRAEIGVRRAINPKKRWIQKLTAPLQRLWSKVHPPATTVEMQSCLACAFLQTKYPFPDDAISRLYVDYRSDSYNTERTYYEPGYPEIAAGIGEHIEEGRARIEALTAWLTPKLNGATPSMLDFGGANGKYLPDIPASKFVYEISNIEPVSGVTRIPSQDMLTSYGYVQLAHVLEHVTHPRDLACEVAALVEPNGLFLIEVPQDLDLERLRKLQCGEDDGAIQLHEHINTYCKQAVEHLFRAIGFQVVALDAVPVVSSVAKQFFIRGLGRKPANWSRPDLI